MAFSDYVGFIVPAIKAITNFVRNVMKAREDDGKVTIDELLDCLGTLLTDMFTIFEPIIKDDKE